MISRIFSAILPFYQQDEKTNVFESIGAYQGNRPERFARDEQQTVANTARDYRDSSSSWSLDTVERWQRGKYSEDTVVS